MGWRLMFRYGNSSAPAASSATMAGPVPVDQVRQMLDDRGDTVPEVVKAILLARAAHDPATFEFDSRPYSGAAIYYFEEVAYG